MLDVAAATFSPVELVLLIVLVAGGVAAFVGLRWLLRELAAARQQNEALGESRLAVSVQAITAIEKFRVALQDALDRLERQPAGRR